MSGAFEASKLEFAYRASATPAIAGVDLSVAEGGFLAIIGPNGSGKSTLLRLLLGALRPSSGIVRYEGRPLDGWPRRELARCVAVVAQEEELPFPLTVRELVAMGRYPHLGPFRRPARADETAIGSAMEMCEVDALAERAMSTLSSGERQRARLARALAQQPRALVLDEPTAALDIAHEMTIFELLSDLAASGGKTVVVVTHNLNLAARYAERLLLLERGRSAAEGAAAEVITRERIERVYGWPVSVFPHGGPGRDAGAPQIAPLAGVPRHE